MHSNHQGQLDGLFCSENVLNHTTTRAALPTDDASSCSPAALHSATPPDECHYNDCPRSYSNSVHHSPLPKMIEHGMFDMTGDVEKSPLPFSHESKFNQSLGEQNLLQGNTNLPTTAFTRLFGSYGMDNGNLSSTDLNETGCMTSRLFTANNSRDAQTSRHSYESLFRKRTGEQNNDVPESHLVMAPLPEANCSNDSPFSGIVDSDHLSRSRVRADTRSLDVHPHRNHLPLSGLHFTNGSVMLQAPCTWPSALVQYPNTDAQNLQVIHRPANISGSEYVAKATPPISSLGEARARRNAVRHCVNYHSLPSDVDTNPCQYVIKIHEAIVNLDGVNDGVRMAKNGRNKKPSPGCRKLTDGSVNDLDVWATSWILLEKLIVLYREGCRLYDHSHIDLSKENKERDMGFSERFEAVLATLKCEKNACLNAIRDGDVACEKLVCAPTIMLRRKGQYRAINDRRGQRAPSVTSSVHMVRHHRAKLQRSTRPSLVISPPSTTYSGAVTSLDG